MAIIIGDIHGDVAMAEAFLNYRPQEKHVALGDLVDSRNKVGLESERACLEILLQSSAVLLWGNHDLAYLQERPWRCYGQFGELAFRDLYECHRDRFITAYAVDGWLCTHAGISARLAKTIAVDVLAAGVEEVARWLNDEFANQLTTPRPEVSDEVLRYGYGSLFGIGVCRGGHDHFGGVFWCDMDGEQTQPSPAVGPQIFGHTPVPYPEMSNSYELSHSDLLVGPKWLNLNVTDGGAWVYDTQRDVVLNILSEC